MLNIKIILGSTRPNRAGEKVLNWFKKNLPEDPEIKFDVIDLRDFPLPFFNEVASMAVLKGNYSTDLVKDWANLIKAADGYILITPEYNHGYPAILKNALDHAYFEWNKKPVAFIGYGGMGGARAVEQLRQVAVELQMAPMREAVHIPSVWSAFDEKDNLIDEDIYNRQAKKLIDDLTWWAETLKTGREKIS